MKKILVLVFLLCLFPLSCLAKPIIKCDKQTFDPLTTTYYLEGNVSVDTGSRLITANRAQVELYSLEVYAEGNVNLTQDEKNVRWALNKFFYTDELSNQVQHL